MKILFSSHTLSGFPLEDSFLVASQTGCDGIELVIRFERASRDESFLQKLITKYQLPILAVHQPVWHWPYTSAGMLERLARFASKLGAERIVVHLSVLRFHRPDKIFDFIRSIEKKYKITVGLENGHRGSLESPPRWTWKASELGAILEKYNPNLTLDLPKFILANKDHGEFLNRYASNFSAAHLHGTQGSKIHRSLGESDRDCLCLLSELHARKPDIPVTLEVFPRDWISAPRAADIASIIKRDVQLLKNYASIAQHVRRSEAEVEYARG